MELTPGSLSETIKQSEIKQYLHLVRSSCLSTKTAILNWRESSFKTTTSRSNSLEKEYGNVTVLCVLLHNKAWLLFPWFSWFYMQLYPVTVIYFVNWTALIFFVSSHSKPISYLLLFSVLCLAVLYPSWYRRIINAWRRTAQGMWCMDLCSETYHGVFCFFLSYKFLRIYLLFCKSKYNCSNLSQCQ